MDYHRISRTITSLQASQQCRQSDDIEESNKWIMRGDKYYEAYQRQGIQMSESFQEDVDKEDKTELECLLHANIGKAIQWYLRAATELHDSAADKKIQNLLNDLHNVLNDTQADESERGTVIQICEGLSKQGIHRNARAQSRYILAEAYFHGWSVRKDHQTAFEYYQQAKELFPKAILKIGLIYETYGQIELAFQCYLTPHNNDQEAEGLMHDLLYKQGEYLISGNQTESTAAFNFFKMAEPLLWGEAKAHASNCLGSAYLYGVGGNRIDYRQAFIWYEVAAELGAGHAMNNLGYMYEQGHWVNENYKDAMIWYLKSAESGCVDGMFNFAMKYEEGKIVKKDIRLSLIWYLEAVKQGDVEAKNKVLAILSGFNLCWLNISESFQNKQATFRLCEFVYEQCSATHQDQSNDDPSIALTIAAQSCFLVGCAYQSGSGVVPNRQMAINHYHAAHQLGHEGAKNNLLALGLLPSSGGPSVDMDISPH